MKCSICRRLARDGITTERSSAIPESAASLHRFEPARHASHKHELWRCGECGALYRYHLTYGADVSDSSAEQSLWRLEDQVQELLHGVLPAAAPKTTRGAGRARARRARTLGPSPGARDAALAAALADLIARPDAALALWIVARDGLPLEASIEPAAQALAGGSELTQLHCQQGLCLHAASGVAEARAVEDAMMRYGAGHYARLVMRACATMLRAG